MATCFSDVTRIFILSQPASCFESSIVFSSRCLAYSESVYFALVLDKIHMNIDRDLERMSKHNHKLQYLITINLKGCKDILYFNTIILNNFKTDQILAEANKELIHVARWSQPSAPRERGFGGLSSDTWMSEALGELSTRCPTVNNILCGLLESAVYPEKKNLALCLIYGIINLLRCHESSRIQRINSVMLIEDQASVNVSCFIYLPFLTTCNQLLYVILLSLSLSDTSN